MWVLFRFSMDLGVHLVQFPNVATVEALSMRYLCTWHCEQVAGLQTCIHLLYMYCIDSPIVNIWDCHLCCHKPNFYYNFCNFWITLTRSELYLLCWILLLLPDEPLMKAEAVRLFNSKFQIVIGHGCMDYEYVFRIVLIRWRFLCYTVWLICFNLWSDFTSCMLYVSMFILVEFMWSWSTASKTKFSVIDKHYIHFVQYEIAPMLCRTHCI